MVLVSAGLVLGATVRGGALVADPWVARRALTMGSSGPWQPPRLPGLRAARATPDDTSHHGLIHHA